uniref:IFT81_CH domain-containing protein n=1 Tax=Steinernema glaseri TaxID=37863 RepID=A0A1I7ZJG6_9BILA
MSTETLKTIIDSLNAEPFNAGLDVVTFSALPNDKLLQHLSNVICWVDGEPFIDIKREGADETAFRIFNALRIIRYRPPADIESLQEWRSQIVEGEPTALYPIFDYIFSNIEEVREKMYLARFLIRVDIPAEYQSDPEIAELLSQTNVLMDQFKEVHQEASKVRSNSDAVEDIMRDLKLMDEEKDQLKRKIDIIQRKTQRISNMDKHLALATLHRKEQERAEDLQTQKQAGRNAEIIAEQQMQRLDGVLQDLEKTSKAMDFAGMIETLEEEIATDRYMSEEKLAGELEAACIALDDLKKIVSIPVMDRRDIDELKREIENKNAEVIQITEERDNREQQIDESLSIYRHQANAVQRKKAGLADQLQRAREELATITESVEMHRQELIEKSGTDEFITSVQFKTYGERLRVKSNAFKRKNSELDRLTTEISISEETLHLLQSQWQDLRDQIERSGVSVSENLEEEVRIPERPKTAKPKSTDVEELKDMVREMTERLNEEKTEVNMLTERVRDQREEVKNLQAELANRIEQREATRNDLLSAISEGEAKTESLEEALAESRQQREATRNDLLSAISEGEAKTESLEEALAESRRRAAELEEEVEQLHIWLDKLDDGPEMVRQLEADIEAANNDRHQLIDMEKRRPPRPDGAKQMAMWKALEQIFLKKIELARSPNKKPHDNFGEAPIGDRPPRVETAMGHRN